MAKLITVGDKYGRLTVLIRAGLASNGDALWQCLCDCGTEKIARASNLRTGHTRSCGCFQRECATAAATRHGKTETRTYHCWRGMIQRCINPRSPAYADYGGRGVHVCTRWQSFENFLEDMGECPPGHSIDRVNNNGNYEPTNCRWATPKMQNRNTRNNRLLEHNGQTKCVAEWADDLGIPASAILKRLRRGYPVAQALSSKLPPVRSPRRIIDGEDALRLRASGATFAEIGARYGVSAAAAFAAVKRVQQRRLVDGF